MLPRWRFARDRVLCAATLALTTPWFACIPPETSLGEVDAQAGDGADAGARDASEAQSDDLCAMLGAAMCDQCCTNHHPGGAAAYDNAWYDCVCTPSRCLNKCMTTDCNPSDEAGSPMIGDPCDLCEIMYAPLDGGGPCGAPILAECEDASADCLAYNNCEWQCPY